MRPSHLFTVVWHLLGGFLASLTYCGVTGLAVWWWQPIQLATYLDCFIASFNCVISGSLIIGVASFLFVSQRSVTQTIEASIQPDALAAATKYKIEKRRYFSAVRSIAFSTNFVLFAAFIFHYCKFPLSGLAEQFIIGFSCLEYALGAYVGRKLFYIARMMYSISGVKVTKSLFRESELDSVITYVNILSTLTAIFVYVHVKSYYGGPFLYNSIVSASLKIVFLLPAIIATPVLVLFNFYPRAVLRRLYRKSISEEVSELTIALRNEHLSDMERMSFMIAYDRLAKDELKSMLQLSLSDLPMAITVIVTIIGVLVRI
jgi:hypothetical protein